MSMRLFYEHRLGRRTLKLIMKTGIFKVVAWFLRTKISKELIKPYIQRNQIDMTQYAGQKYASFADFFARKRETKVTVTNEDELISPCDGLLSIYPIETGMEIPMKGSRYILEDLIPDKKYANLFAGGLCLVFRLEASDYHHFCFIDDCIIKFTRYIEGELHSVQPIAHRRYPVYRLNRRWWSILDTKHFGKVAQIEVGAMLVGGVTLTGNGGYCRRGTEMGNFELCGSTIIIVLPTLARTTIRFRDWVEPSWNGKKEIRVRMGESIGILW